MGTGALNRGAGVAEPTTGPRLRDAAARDSADIQTVLSVLAAVPRSSARFDERRMSEGTCEPSEARARRAGLTTVRPQTMNRSRRRRAPIERGTLKKSWPSASAGKALRILARLAEDRARSRFFRSWDPRIIVRDSANTAHCCGRHTLQPCSPYIATMHTVMVPAGTSQVPTPLPHPYLGKLKDKLSTDVEINGKKAAVKGSKAKFDSPGHFPTPPGTSFQNKPNNEAEITNGCADKVTINGKAAATLGSNATSCDDTGAQNQSTVVAAGAAVVLPIKLPCIDDRTFKQDGGFMFNTRNPQNKSDPSEKEKKPKLSSPKWGKTKAKVGEAVKLSVSSSELYENANVEFTIWKDGADETKDEPVKKVWGKNQGGKAEAEWTWYYRAEDWPEPFKEKPKFYFTAEAFKCEKVKSGTVEMSMDIKMQLLENDEALKNTKYTLHLPDGSTKDGTTDADGNANETDLIPGEIRITIAQEEGSSSSDSSDTSSQSKGPDQDANQ